MLNDTIYQNIEDEDLDVNKLAKIMNMSRVSLYRKIKSISDLTPVELINITRLKRAAELLSTGEYRIYEIAAMVGFSSQSNFSRYFLKQFGMTPTNYMLSKQEPVKKDKSCTYFLVISFAAMKRPSMAPSFTPFSIEGI